MSEICNTRNNNSKKSSLKPNNLKIELMSKKFLDQLCEIEKVSFKEPYTKQFLRYLSEICSHAFLIATINGVFVGYIVAIIIKNRANLISLAIAPKWRKKGFGEYLMNRIMEITKSHGAKKIYLEVREKNFTAIRFYKKLGFQVKSKLSNYYKNQESALVLLKNL